MGLSGVVTVLSSTGLTNRNSQNNGSNKNTENLHFFKPQLWGFVVCNAHIHSALQYGKQYFILILI
jgi:hypothetical protein